MPESVEAASWTIYDPQSKQTLAEYNSHAQRAPASLTKMMVAYITLQELQAKRFKTSDILTATSVVKMIQPDESQMFLREGQQISIDQLLSGLVVMSANDAAVTLAERIGGNVPHFVERMNQEAQKLGMSDTHFTNPAGITMQGHYSSAADLAKLANTLIQQYPEYLHYSKQQSYDFNGHHHEATNVLVKLDPTVDGLKTGYTSAAGYNLALTAKRNDRRLIVVVMGTKSAVKRAEVAYELMNMTYQYTHNEIPIQHNQLLATLPIINGKETSFKLVAPQNYTVTTSLYPSTNAIDMRQFNLLTQQLPIPPLTTAQTQINFKLLKNTLNAPIQQTIDLANIEISQNNQILQTILVNQNVQLEEANWFQRLINWFKGLIFSQETPKAVVYPSK